MGTPHTKRLTQAERTALSDKRITDATIRLIAKQGYSKTSLAQIADEAGYTAGLISHRFGSKDALLFKVAESIVASTGAGQIAPAMSGHTGVDAVCALADAYLAGLEARADRTRALFVLMFESLGPVPSLRPYFVEYTRRMRRDLERAISEGIEAEKVRSDTVAATEAVVIVALLRGIAMQWLMDPEGVDLDLMRTRAVESIRSSLESQALGSQIDS